MGKVLLFSVLLIVGLAGSQTLPYVAGEASGPLDALVTFLTMAGLAFIMVHVGYEFEIDKRNVRQYGWDYVVAATAAAFPWVFCCAYFVLLMLPAEAWSSWPVWKEALLASRFAAPTSAGVLFSMLAAAGLSATWVFRKARVLAIFDDLDTVLLMIPLKMAMVGVRWQLALIVVVMIVQLGLAWRYLHRVRLPVTWPWVLGYALAIALLCEGIYRFSKLLDDTVPVHIEVLLPAFVLGCMLARPRGHDPHRDDARNGHQEGPEAPNEQRVSTIVSAVFMVLVGLSMPVFIGPAVADTAPPATIAGKLAALTPPMSWGAIALHVLVITLLANLGKMFCVLCYRRAASLRERFAVAIGMWPRGEVGAGVLVLSLSYGIAGPVVVVAMLSLALNLLLTGGFIWIIKRLLRDLPPREVASPNAA
ncbi:MAG TPA: sodium:proton antiporter [Phycisphaerae bacterium]|nr:sodium:proton antiporter [Phycisphaerae bacterium]HNU46646.1 sodium:proton antiporter [Phycisphaerae bacterium]